MSGCGRGRGEREKGKIMGKESKWRRKRKEWGSGKGGRGGSRWIITEYLRSW